MIAPRRAKAPIAAICLAAGLLAASPTFPAASSANQSPFLPGANSKEPVSIDADKLVYSDKEQKAVYTGNVIAIQGDTKLTCSVMTILLVKTEPADAKPASGADAKLAAGADAKPASGPDAAPSAGSSQVKHMDAVGPVTVISKTQVATGDNGSYDKEQNKVWLIGHVTLSDGGNITKGDRLTYDLTTGQATVDNGKTNGRVHGQFIPGSSDNASPAPGKNGKQ
jgi:lipopolysaccharide export system protein LptA